MVLRLILDRSVFHGERFYRLVRTLTILSSRGSVCLYITPMILEETLGLLLKRGNNQELRDHLKFIIGISKTRWFEDNFEIFKSELGIWSVPKEYYIMEKKAEDILRENINAIIQGSTFSSDDQAFLKKLLEDNYRKAEKMRTIGKEMRLKISLGSKRIGIKHGIVHKKLKWETFKKRHLNKFGKNLINNKNFNSLWSKYTALFQWMFNRKRCGYFAEWITGLLYMQYYAMTYPNDAIDENSQADIQHLIYLRDTDGIVSEDKSFMKKAWEELYKNQGKLYLSIVDLETKSNDGC